MAPITKDELEEMIVELEQHRGRATELITIYIPAGQNIYTVANQLEAEKGTAKNIKSTSTRKNVTDSLDKISRELKNYKKTPDNGLALFCGNISKVEGQSDLQVWQFEPPEEMKMRLYRCDKEFVLEPLKEMTEIKEIYGLVVMDRKEATIGVLEGKRIEVLHKMTSGVPSKVRAGGQSSQRFHRITEGLTKEFYKRIAEEVKNSFIDNPKLKGIIVGGPIPTKDEWVDGEYLITNLRTKIIGVIDIGDTDESGLKELVEKSKEILSKQEIIKEKKLLVNFFNHLGGNRDMTAYDYEPIKKALDNGAVETLILSKKLNKDQFKELKMLAENISSKIEVVSSDTEEGEQFWNITHGMGAILRFVVH
ncbi:peptide chain release factor 1 [Candidatus Pacearchaeota archaeon CG10_big_fil_rev_8_21_14_0_10_32_14]|nr:MAG: peptide chain release factor 1 [Candidatus Pacearchaeota archaeon CG10_big_fil_rev_8_21_14_0_10_32_14]